MGRVLFLLFVLLLTSCRLPGMVGTRPVASVEADPSDRIPAQPVRGRVEWLAGSDSRGIQALIPQLASASVVSVIDANTGVTVGATVSDASGSFSVSFGPLFRPTHEQVFIADVVKGIQVDGIGPYNQAGADALRLRTLLYYDAPSGGWKSLTSGAPDAVVIGKRTTALAAGISLWQQAGLPVNLLSYLNAIPDNAGYNPPAQGIEATDFNDLYAIIGEAIDRDRDPIQYTAIDPSSRKFSNTFVGFAITDVLPRTGTITTAFTITGSGFNTGAVTVAINGVPATLTSVTFDTIQAKVGPGSRTGPVSVRIGGVLQAGPTFAVQVADGHQCMLNGKLYVVNPSWGTLAQVSPNGDVATVVTGLGSPQQVAVGPLDGKLYVAAKDDGKVWKVDPAGGFSKTSFAVLASAHGLAFDASGNLYVSSNQGAGSVVKYNPAGGVVATYGGFTNPQSLALDYHGNLYVVEAAGTVTQVAPGDVRTVWATLSSPKGLAIDSAANLYIASDLNGAIYKVDPWRNSSVFAVINSPSGLTFDAAGYMYISDSERNLIYRISPAGNLIPYAYGIANPRGLAVDPANGTLYLSCSQSNAVLQVNPSDGVLKRFLTGIANPSTLTWRGNGMYIGQPEINTVSFVDRSSQMSTVVTGVPWASGADKAADGKLYVGLYTTCGTRPDAWQPNRDPMYLARYGILAAGTLTWRYPYITSNSVNGGSSFRAVDAPVAGVQHVYDICAGGKTLTMVTLNANGSQTVERLYTFASTPNDVTYDASGNVYVAAPAEHKVYRFTKAAGYVATGMSGFNSPWGLAIDSNGVLWVTNQDGLLRKITTPATATEADIGWTSAAIPGGLTSAPTHITGLAAKSGSNYLYLTCDAKILQYDTVGNSFTDYLGYDLPNNVQQIWVGSGGVMYAREHLSQTYFTLKVDKTYAQWIGQNYGGASTFDPNGKRWDTGSYGAQIGICNTTTTVKNGYVGALGLTGEVAVDQTNQYLYLASQGGDGTYAGVFRYDLSGAKPKELFISLGTGTAQSLAIDAGGNVYAGSANGHVYLVDLAGATVDKWTIPGAVPYGLDLYNGNQLWAVGSDGKVYDIPTGGGTVNPHLYGLMGPTL